MGLCPPSRNKLAGACTTILPTNKKMGAEELRILVRSKNGMEGEVTKLNLMENTSGTVTHETAVRNSARMGLTAAAYHTGWNGKTIQLDGPRSS